MLTISDTVQSVVRSFAIIETLAASSEAQTLKAIAASCNLPTPTTYRLLNNLCNLKYVIREEGGKYKLSHRLFEISSGAITRASLVSIAKPYLDAMSAQLRESVHLVVRNENNVIYVYKVAQQIGTIRMASRIGASLPMYRCATGKAIMATLPDEEIRAIFNASVTSPVTHKTITDFDVFMRQIEQIRICDYAIDDEENEQGIKCIAASLGHKGNDVHYAFSVSSLSSRMTGARLNEISRILLEVKEKIVSELANV